MGFAFATAYSNKILYVFSSQSRICFLLLADKTEDLFFLIFKAVSLLAEPLILSLKCEKIFPPLENQEFLNRCLNVTRILGPFLPGFWISPYEMWALCACLSCQSVCPCRQHWISADASELLHAEAGPCSHPGTATQAVPAEQGSRWLGLIDNHSLIFLIQLRVEQENA